MDTSTCAFNEAFCAYFREVADLKVEKSSYLYNRQYFTLYLHDSGAMVVYVIGRLSKTRGASKRVDAPISQFSLNCLYTSDS